jgi:hypothetical protein
MQFDYFVVLAGMRTGSQFLEWNLSAYPGLTCHGELFHPYLQPKYVERFGLTQAERDADPMRLIGILRRQTQGLGGFRLFHDHDPRIIDAVLDDPRVAKIVLSRNPLDSYVSLKIAEATDQWWLGDLNGKKTARVAFDRAEFMAQLDGIRRFHETILRRLQTSGQTAFFLTYDDVGEVEVMNGLARWLGVDQPLKTTSSRTKKQNPQPLEEKVSNYSEMVTALADIDHFDLGKHPVFEPRRGPTVPHYLAAAQAPVLYMPVRGSAIPAVTAWLARLDGVDEAGLRRNLTQKALRQWMRDHPGHRAFTVLRHPVQRLYDIFCRHILATDGETLRDVRRALGDSYGLKLPARGDDPLWGPSGQRAAFKGFARFVAGNLAGQTSLRVEPVWATQTALLQGMAQFALPDLLLREEDLAVALPRLAGDLGLPVAPFAADPPPARLPLAEIYDDETEALVRQAYQRDYLAFGFARWR